MNKLWAKKKVFQETKKKRYPSLAFKLKTFPGGGSNIMDPTFNQKNTKDGELLRIPIFNVFQLLSPRENLITNLTGTIFLIEFTFK